MITDIKKLIFTRWSLWVINLFFMTPAVCYLAGGQNIQPSSPPLTLETVIISADRSLYLPGDELMASLTVAEADTYKPSALSSIVRIEIISHEGIVILAEKASSLSGELNIRLRIPEGTPTGWYQLRAYTNYMRNFNPNYYSTISFRVVNPSEISGLQRSEETDSIMITLFAPGNQTLFAGRENKCALYASDLYGNPFSLSGYLVSDKGDTLTVNTGRTGWGSILFIPREETSYIIVPVNKNLAIKNFYVPEVGRDVAFLEVEHSLSNYKLKIEIPAAAGLSECRILVHSLYTWYSFSETKLIDGKAEVSIPLSGLPESGIFQFSILDTLNNLLISRLWSPSGSEPAATHLNTEPGTISLRENREVSYSTDNGSGHGIYNVIVRIKEPAEQGDKYIPGLPGWPYSGSIPRQKYEFEAWMLASMYNPEIIKNIMGGEAAGAPVERIINFSETASAREDLVKFLPEINGHVIAGRVVSGISGIPVQAEPLTLTTFSDRFIYTAATSPSGKFHFVVPDKTGVEDAMISFLRKPEEKLRLELMPDFDSSAVTTLPSRVTLSEGEDQYIRTMWTRKQLSEIYTVPVIPETPDQVESSAKNVFNTLGYPDYSVYVDDFIRLPNMREVIAEVVPTVIARRRGDEWSLRLVNDQTSKDEMLPLILLDGLPLTGFNEFLQLPPERIRKIDVFTKIYVRGNVSFGGAVGFFSVNGDLAGLKLPDDSRIIQIKFSADSVLTEHRQKDPNMPMLQPVLAHPRLFRGNRGIFSFSTGDIPGEFVIIVSGYTEGGIPVYASQSIIVEPRQQK